MVVTPDKCNCSIPAVHIVDSTTGTVKTSFLAYEPSYRGGVRVATGDLNGDGIDEIVTAPGRNHSPLVKVFDQSGNLLYSFMPYAKTFKGGVNVAIGDINGDGKNDIVTAMSYNGNQVKVFRNTSSAASLAFTAFGSSFTPFGTAFKGGAVVVAADLGQPKTVGKTKSLDSSVLDGKAEIIVGNGSGMRSTIKEFTYFGTSSTATLVRTLLPFSPTFRGGISLDVANLNDDGPIGPAGNIPDIIVAAGNGGNSQVQVMFDVHIVWRMLPAAVGTLLLGSACFCALGLAVAALVPNGEAAPVVANFTVLPVVFISDLFFPMDAAPAWLRALGSVFPVKHFALALEETFNPFVGGAGWRWDHLAVVALWGVAGVLVAVRKFQWEPRTAAGPRRRRRR